MDYKVHSAQSAHGGRILQILFDEKPDRDEIDKAIRTLDDCPFGYRILGTGEYVEEVVDMKVTYCLVTVKIYND